MDRRLRARGVNEGPRCWEYESNEFREGLGGCHGAVSEGLSRRGVTRGLWGVALGDADAEETRAGPVGDMLRSS